MINLAGAEDCDNFIRGELSQVGITCMITKDNRDEVPYTVFGVLGHPEFSEDDWRIFNNMGVAPEYARDGLASFVFTRAWVYWRVSGYVPLEVANEMYFSEDTFHYRSAKNKYGIRAKGDCGNPPPSERVDHRLICGKQAVSSYHIDTQEGLKFFVDTIKKNNLV